MIKLKDILTEKVKDNKVICDSCGWTWNISDGGKDIYTCHKCGNDNTPISEDLRKWFGKGKTGSTTGGGWDRYNSKGEKVGKCGDSKDGSAYAACLSKEKAAKLGPDGRASFVKRKRAAQSDAGDSKKGGEQKKGQKPTLVKTGASESVNELTHNEKSIRDGNSNNVYYAFYKGQFEALYTAMGGVGLTDYYWDKFKVRRPAGSKFKLNPELIVIPKKEYDRNPNHYSKLKPHVDNLWDKLQNESVNEAAMNPVKKVVNAILKKHNIQAMKTYASSVGGAHNMTRGGYRYEGDYFLGFYGKISQDDIEKVGADMKRAGVKGVDVKKGIISADFTKNGLSEDWSQKYKKSIDCNNPKGFSQKAHCAGKTENMKLTVEQKMELFLEKNVPTDPAKWSASKAAAKRKFDVYPSAYANGWAAKNYKEKGGGWKTAK